MNEMPRARNANRTSTPASENEPDDDAVIEMRYGELPRLLERVETAEDERDALREDVAELGADYEEQAFDARNGRDFDVVAVAYRAAEAERDRLAGGLSQLAARNSLVHENLIRERRRTEELQTANEMLVTELESARLSRDEANDDCIARQTTDAVGSADGLTVSQESKKRKREEVFPHLFTKAPAQGEQGEYIIDLPVKPKSKKRRAGVKQRQKKDERRKYQNDNR